MMDKVRVDWEKAYKHSSIIVENRQIKDKQAFCLNRYRF